MRSFCILKMILQSHFRLALVALMVHGGLAAPVAAGKPTHRNVRYSEEFHRSTADLWLPRRREPTPLVIYFHGGGFRQGSKYGIVFEDDFTSLPKQGVAFASVGYPLEGDLPKREQMPVQRRRRIILKHTVQAIEHLKRHAGDYNLDTNRFVVSGSSAGAVISAYLAYHEDLNISACVAMQQPKGAAQIAELIHRGDPPLVLYTSSGPDDRLHHPSYARLLKEHCDRIGTPCYLFGSPKSGLPPVPDRVRFVPHMLTLLGDIWNSPSAGP